MMAAMDKGADLSSLRIAVSAGETLPAPVFENWTRRTGKTILDGIGSTELLHIFITNRVGDAVAGTTGHPVGGYEAKIVDDDMNELPPETVGKLAVRGPTASRWFSSDTRSGCASAFSASTSVTRRGPGRSMTPTVDLKEIFRKISFRVQPMSRRRNPANPTATSAAATSVSQSNGAAVRSAPGTGTTWSS